MAIQNFHQYPTVTEAWTSRPAPVNDTNLVVPVGVLRLDESEPPLTAEVDHWMLGVVSNEITITLVDDSVMGEASAETCSEFRVITPAASMRSPDRFETE